MAFCKHHIYHRVAAVFLLVACLLPMLATPAYATAVVSTGQTDRASKKTTTVSPSQWLISAGESVSAAEADWLDHEAPEAIRAAMTLSYGEGPVPECLSVTFDGNEHPVLTAVPIEGQSNRGTVTWRPVAVVWEGETYALTLVDGRYTTTLTPPDEGGTTATVTYEAVVTVPAEEGSALYNAAYEAALAADEAYTAYETALAAYTEQERAYTEYQAALTQYRSELAVYQAYRRAMEAYETKLAAYEQYLAEVKAYEADLSAYHAYLEAKAQYDKENEIYMGYINDPETYQMRYLAYCRWLENIKTMDNQLLALESCFVMDAKGNQLYATLHGPTVATVVERKNELVSAGCEKEDIDNADRATSALQTLLKAYPRTETREARYEFYKKNYTALKDNVRLLYTSLSTLYGQDMVAEVLDMQGKLQRYWQFVGQLYVLTCLLDDGEMWSTGWSIGGKSLTSVVDSRYFLEDLNSASPLGNVVYAMEEVTPPDQLQKPVAPTAVVKPTAPEAVAEPIPPEEVKNPTPPLAVSRPDASKKPMEPAFSQRLEALRTAVREGTLTRRTLPTEALSMTLQARVDKVILPAARPTVYLYAYDGTTLLQWLTVGDDGCVILPNVPARPDDAAFTYEPIEWRYRSGTAVEGNTLSPTEDVNLYAAYTAVPRTYTVSWVVDGVITEATVAYGEMPTFTGDVSKAPDAAAYYEFMDWSPTPSVVTGDVTYTARYRVTPRSYTVTWQWDGMDETLSDTYDYGDMPVCDVIPTRPMNGRYAYTFIGWSPEVTAVNGDTLYEAMFSAEDLFPRMPEDARVSVSETDEGLRVFYEGATAEDGSRWIDVSRVAALAAEEGTALLLVTEDLAVTFSHAAVISMVEKGCCLISPERTLQGLTISLCNAEKHPLSNGSVPVSVYMSPLYNGSLRVYNADGALCATADEGASVTFRAETGMTYTVQDGHQVTVSTSEGGLCLPSATFVPAGTTVRLTVTPHPGYTCNGVCVIANDGSAVETVAWDDGTYHFTMPVGGVTVTPTYTPLRYRVTFTVEGSVYQTGEYGYGETPAQPDPPTRESDVNGSYVFKGWRLKDGGWDNYGIMPVFSDAEYEAVFEAVPHDTDHVSVQDSDLRIWQLVVLGFVCFTGAVTAVLVPFFRQRRKRRK